MVPLLSLGIPGNPVTALLIGALIIHGVQPGPMLMTQHPDIFWGVIASMYIGNVMLLILNLPLVGIWVQFLKLPYKILFPIIFLLCVIGSYAANLNMFDVWVMIGFGILGFLVKETTLRTGTLHPGPGPGADHGTVTPAIADHGRYEPHRLCNTAHLRLPAGLDPFASCLLSLE